MSQIYLLKTIVLKGEERREIIESVDIILTFFELGAEGTDDLQPFNRTQFTISFGENFVLL
jgi:hypothetical protein